MVVLAEHGGGSAIIIEKFYKSYLSTNWLVKGFVNGLLKSFDNRCDHVCDSREKQMS